MPDQEQTDDKDRDAAAGPEGEKEVVVPGGAAGADTPVSELAECAKERKLTPEEQMAQYEESLKDEDWGHQPC